MQTPPRTPPPQSPETATMPEVVEGKLDWRGRPAIRAHHGGLSASTFAIGLYAMDTLSTGVISLNLVEYLTTEMHQGIADASNLDTNFLGTLCILTIPLGYLADAFVGRYRTAVAGGLVEVLAIALLAVQAHSPATGRSSAALQALLYLLALSSAAVKAAVPPHGADQFDERDPREAKLMSGYFNCLLLGETAGVLVGLAAVVHIQTDVSWAWGFGVCAVCSFVGTVFFAAGAPMYRISPTGVVDPAVELVAVFVAAFRNRGLPLPEDPSELYEVKQDEGSPVEVEFIPHGDKFRFLDKAASRVSGGRGGDGHPGKWKLCTVTQVEKAKIIVAMVPIFLSTVALSLCFAQFQTFSVEQGYTMDRRIAPGLTIPPQPIIPCVLMIVAIPAYDRLFVPFARRLTGIPTGITHLQRIGAGLFFSIFSMITAALVEARRKRVAGDHGMLDAVPVVQPLPMSVLWLTIQYVLLAIGEVLAAVGMLEFFYSEAPASLKSLATSFYWASTALGYFFSTAIVKLVNRATAGGSGGGWLAGNNINRSHLDLFFWLMAVICFLNFINYLYWASWYKYRPRASPKAAAKSPFLGIEA